MIEVNSLAQSKAVMTIVLMLAACNTSQNEVARDCLLVNNIHVVNVTDGTLSENQTIMVRNGLIEAIYDFSAENEMSCQTVIDGQGKYAMPGLIDMHSHVMDESDAAINLYHGVTTVRVMWGEPSLLKLKEQVEKGHVDGPRMYISGRIVDGANAIQFGTVELTDPENAEKIVLDYKAAGYDFLKTYSNMSLEVFQAISEAANKHNFPFAGHIPTAVPAEIALSSGMESSSHFYAFQTASLKDGSPNLTKPSETMKVAEDLGQGKIEIDSFYDQTKIDRIVELAKNSDFSVVPTFEVLKIFTDIPMRNRPTDDSYHRPGLKAYWQNMHKLIPFSENTKRGQTIILEKSFEIARQLADAGVPLITGTDAPIPGVYRGAAVIEEIKTFHERVGLSIPEALKTATVNAANVLGYDTPLGLITEGALADFNLLSANPLEDLEALFLPDWVIVRGQAYDRASLNAKMAAFRDKNDQILALFQTARDLGPEYNPLLGTLMEFRTIDGAAQRLGIKRGETETKITTLLREANNPNWTESEIVIDQNGSKIYRNNTLIASSENALILTGNLSDLLILDSMVQTILVGENATVRVVRCDWSGNCGQEENISLERLPDNVRDLHNHMYYTGYKPFAVSGNADFTPQEIWLGGGGYTGQIVGYRPNDHYGAEWLRVR